MKSASWWALVVLGGLGLVLLAGCGEAGSSNWQGQARPPASAGPRLAPPASAKAKIAEARTTTFKGWKAAELSNSLVKVVCVPAIGGRMMEFSLKGENALWVNPDEAGKLYPAPKDASERIWHNYGGFKVWPAPQSRWGGPPDPLGSRLDGGPWQVELLRRRGPTASLSLASEADESVTGLRFFREIQLFAGSTNCRVVEKMQNVGAQPVTWSLWDVTQVPGAAKPKGAADERCRVYFPASETGDFTALAGDKSGAQWRPDAEHKLMCVVYTGEMGKIGVHSLGGWAAYHNGRTGLTLVKRFKVFPDQEYPDENSTVEVWTSPLPEAYMEVEVLSPLVTLQAGQEYTFTEDWYLCRAEGPILDATPAGVICKHLALSGEKQALVTASYGVNTPCTWQLTALDAQGKPLAETKGECGSEKPFELKAKLAVEPSQLAKLVLRLLDGKGKAFATLDEVKIR